MPDYLLKRLSEQLGLYSSWLQCLYSLGQLGFIFVCTLEQDKIQLQPTFPLSITP